MTQGDSDSCGHANLQLVLYRNVSIGANAVVTHDVPDNACVGGVPARIISMDGSEGYVNRKV